MKTRFLLTLLFTVWGAGAQRLDPAKWSLSVEPAAAPAGSRVLGRLVVKLDPGWHLYSLSTPKGGPIPTTIRPAQDAPIDALRVYQPKPSRAMDPNFNLETETYDREVEFLLEIGIRRDAPEGSAELRIESRYQLCNDRMCLPPVRRTAAASILIKSGAAAPGISIPAGYTLHEPGTPSPPVPNAPAAPASAPTQGLSVFLLIAFGLGLAAIFTPCVFPMIPITLSFFLNQQAQTRRQSVFQAVLFCLGIIVLFSSLGIAATALLGPFGVVQLGSNVWVNSFIAAVFLIFALSLLGAFDLSLPSSLLTRMDRVSQRGGVLGALLMGLTFSLTSFACVGPFVGTLLAGSLQGGSWRPLLGMVFFASGLALPFFLLALFPSYLRRLPKSGGWMMRVKIVLGFVILAAMLKYWSNVDQVMQWGFLTRERFLAAWVVLFSAAGLYLLGFLRMEGIDREEPVTVGRLLAGSFLLIFAVSLVPGMFGGRLGELDAYVPLATSAAPTSTGASALTWRKNQYAEALQEARAGNKLVFVNFTGYACTNCHWMKANMFTRPEIVAAMRDFILVELYTDGADASSRSNQEMQEKQFSTIAIPYYAIVSPDEKVVATFAGLTRNPQEFLEFLKKGSRQ